MKHLMAALIAVASLSGGAATFSYDVTIPAVRLTQEGVYSALDVSDDAYLVNFDAVGKPAIPTRTLLVAVPDFARVTGVTYDATWETLATDRVIAPIAPPVREGEAAVPATPDATVYNGTAVYPSAPVACDGEGRMCGVRFVAIAVTPFRWHPATRQLERAAKLTVNVAFEASSERSYAFAADQLAGVRAAVVNPTAVGLAQAVARPKFARSTAARLTTASAANAHVDYLLISPPDFIDDWRWYVGERKKAHSNLVFQVKNTAEIYDEHPFGADLPCRNAAESIHAYLRQAVSNGVQYVVLGGAWLDAQNRLGITPYFASGELMSLSNCVPGIYGYPREEWRDIPSDMFYACLDMVNGQKYPWDANNNGKYIDQNDCANNDLYPDVMVSRLTLNPYTGISGKVYNPHALITNYVAKLKRGEAKDFAGHYRYGMSAASTGSSRLRKNVDRMYYKELEFYDGMLNMFDPRHHDTIEDDEYSTRVRYFNQYSMWRPVREVKGMMSYTWTGGQPSLSAAMDDYYDSDRDFGFVQAHGWAQGAACFSAGRFAQAKGLTLFNGGSGPCETGYPDYYPWSGGKQVLQYNVGDAAVTNPDGGALASVNNSRWSWAGGGGYGAMSYYMLNEMLIGFNQDRMDVGHAWLKGCRNYWPVSHGGGTHTWCLTEQFLYGDPLVRLPEVPNVWWTGGPSGVWDRVAANWTNSVDAAATFDAANNVYFSVTNGLSLDIAGEIAAMRLSLPVFEEDAVLTLAGTGTLRVMQAIDVAGTNATLRFNVAGGVGHNGIRFLTGAGDLVFEGTNRFYVGGVSNAKAVKLLGGGVTLDVDEFEKGSFPLLLDGARGSERPAVANELRSAQVGGLNRFGPLAITHSYVKLATVDAFGNGAPVLNTLVDSKLEIAANVYYQRSGFPEGLNATFLTAGDCEVTSSLGGTWTVKHTTAFALDTDTHLTLSAETVNGGGRIVVTNRVDDWVHTNTVVIANASALAGDVVIGRGIRLVLRELPLAAVTSLTVGEGATVELPDDESGYWQIIPVSSKFTCADGVTFTTASNPAQPLDGSPSMTGSFFKEGSLYRWTGREGDWNLYFANRHPKLIFGDLDDRNDVTVRVATAVSPEFAFFSNLRTRYVYQPTVDSASIFFTSVFFCGPTAFDVPVSATEYVEISTSTSRFSNLVAPYVHVAAGAGFALAGSHWTDLRLEAGSVLVAVPGEALDWNAETTLTLPDHGAVILDVDGIELTSEPTPLITGVGHAWTLADLKGFKPSRADAELRIVDGALAVVRGDGLEGPYALTFEGAARWNTAAWMSASNAFPKAWGECALNWSADAVVSIPTNPASRAASHHLTVDCDVHVQTLSFRCPSTNVFTLAAEASPRLDVATLDLSECVGTVDVAIDTLGAAILTATNEQAVVHLRRAGSGTITLSGSTVILDKPGDWVLSPGAQGTLCVVAPQAYERFRIAAVPSGFENSGLTIKVTDGAGRVIDGFTTTVSDGALWCVPPALLAEVPPGTNELTHLVWRDAIGNVVSNVDWSASAGFRLIGTGTNGVVIAKHGFASVWNRLSVSNEVVIYGNESLSPTQLPGGGGVLALAGGFTLTVDVNANQGLLSGARLKLLEGTTLEIHHRSTNFDARGQNWSGITGTGRVVFADGIASWIALPNNLFASTLSVVANTDIVLTEGYGTSHRLELSNLSGSGRFRADWSTGNSIRPLRTVQTGVTAFSGCLHKKCDRTAKLIVASDDAVASTNKALVLDGAAVEEHPLDIEPSGCVILTGSWQGPISVEGLLVVTNACATNNLKIATSGNGRILVLDEDELPPLTVGPAYVAPDYPDDPVVPDAPVEADERLRILSASVGAGKSAWSQLEWLGTNGVRATAIDWSAVTNATLSATNGACRILFDAEGFSGVVRLAGGVTVEARALTPFTVAEDSAGTVDLRLDPVPTASTDLVFVAPGTNVPTNVTVTVHDRYGREIDVAGEVTYDAANRKFALYVQNVNRPWFSNTFDTQYDDTLPSCSSLAFSGSGNLTYKDHPANFVTSRSGRALTGTYGTMHSHNDCQNFSMDGVNAFSLNIVARLPRGNGVILCLGGKHKGNGLAFARIAENVAGVYVWENNGSPWVIASANVAFGSTQFHSYAVTHDGTTLKFYVDGVLARSAPLTGKHPSMGYFQWFNIYGGGIAGDSTAAVDDCRLYNYCLTPASVRTIANQFAPWPEYPTAVVDVPDLAWSNLYWSADCDSDDSLTLVAGGGSLKIDSPIALNDSLSITGGTVPVRFAGNGALTVQNGIAALSSLEIDASGLDGAAMAARAVHGVPYSRWLVRGTITGSLKILDGLPAMPHGYAVESVVDAYGARLVVTAPWFAKYRSLNFNFAGHSDKSVYSAVSRVSDNASYCDLAHGAHPIVGRNWIDLRAENGVTATADGVTVVVTGVANAYGTGTAVGDQILYGYADDRMHPTVVVSNIPYASYRIVTYHATDTANTFFCPVWMGATAADAVRYFGPTCNSSVGGYTVSGGSDVTWGDSDCRGALAEGVNFVVSDVITGAVGKATAYVRIPKLSAGRACLAAFQIVEVNGVYESNAVDYRAVVTNDTAWSNGDGLGLAHDIVWQNDTNSIVTLTATTAFHTVTFDTPLTASVVRIVSAQGERLGLARESGVPFAVGSLDLTATRGETVFATHGLDGLSVATLAGTRLRFTGEATMPPFTTAGTIVSYRQATFSSAISPYNWILRTEEPEDTVSLFSAGKVYQYMPIDVSDGTFTLATGGATECYYGGCNSSATNSVITVNGGTFTCDVTGTGTDGSNRGFIFGVTSGGVKQKPTVVVNGGVFQCWQGVLAPWEYGTIVQNGGLMRVWGIRKGGGTAGSLTLNGGILELGEKGILKNGNGAFPATLAGGTVRSVRTASVSVPLSLTRLSCVAATNGTALTFSAAVTGNGGLVVGAPEWTGDVIFSDASTRLGSVALAPGARLTAPIAAFTGDLTVGEGATLNLVQTQSFADVTNRICSGAFAFPTNAVLLLNGEPLPSSCVREGNALVVSIRRTWRNPVTDESQVFSYRFVGAQSGQWEDAANWQKSGLFDWQPLSDAKVPMLPNNNLWDPTVIDGAFITNAAFRSVTLNADMEGWQPRLAVFNGATVTVQRIKKFQSENATKFLWVDDSSRLVFQTLGGDSYNDVLNLCVASSNGITFATQPGASGATFQYSLKGDGSVLYSARLTQCAHKICRADFTLSAGAPSAASPQYIGKTVRTKRLVAFPDDSTVKFTWSAPSVLLNDPANERSVATLKASVSSDDPIGCCALTQRVDGVWLDYVDRAPSANFVHTVETSNVVRHIEIPEEWLKKLSQGPEPLLPTDNLTPDKIAVALESNRTANGLKPWQSYVLGLDPTNAADRISARMTFVDGAIRIEAHGLDSAKFQSGAGVRYRLEATDDLSKSFETLRTAQEPTAFEGLTTENASQFYRIVVDILWN